MILRRDVNRDLTHDEVDGNFIEAENLSHQAMDAVEAIGSGEGGKGYPTLADALAADIPDNVIFQVDPGSEDEGIWRRDSSDPEGAVFLRKFPKELKPQHPKSNQLLNKDNHFEGTLSQQGELVTDPYNGLTSDFLPVKKSETHITVSKSAATTISKIAFYDDNEVYIDGSFTEFDSNITVTIPTNASFFRVYFYRNQIPEAQIELTMVNYGQELLPWDPYSIEAPVRTVPISNQVFNKEYYSYCYFNGSGNIRLESNSPHSFMTRVIPIVSGITHITMIGVNASGTTRGVFYDEYMNPINGIFDIRDSEHTQTIIEGAKYVQVMFSGLDATDDSALDTFALFFSAEPLEIDEYKEQVYQIGDASVLTKYDIEETVEVEKESLSHPAGNQLLDAHGFYHEMKTIDEEGKLIDAPPVSGDPLQRTSDFLPIQDGQTHISISKKTLTYNRVAFYDKDEKFIEGSFTEFSDDLVVIPIPANASFFRYYYFRHGPEILIEHTMVNYGEQTLPWEPYKGRIGTKAVSNQRFNREDIYRNTIIQSNGRFSENYDGITTGVIEIDEGVNQIHLRGLSEGYINQVRFVDEYMNYVSNLNFLSESTTLSVPPGAKFVNIMVKHYTEPDESALNTFVLNFSSEPLKDDEYKEQVYEIEGHSVFHPSDLSDEEAPSVEAGVPKATERRYIDDFELKEKVQQLEKYNDTLQSLRKIKTTDAGELEVTIPNTSGVELRDVVVPLNLHYGSQTGVTDPYHIFMDGMSNKDFSDIRFLANGELLDFYKESNGNYELIPDENVYTHMTLLPNGDVARSSGSVMELSTDSGYTWQPITPTGKVVGSNQLNDIIYWLSDGLYKTTKQSDYSEYEKLNIDLDFSLDLVIRQMAFGMDDLGHLYLGQYQTPFGTVVWKSENDGNDWYKSHESEKQHVHSIYIDKSVVPNIVYANCDGYRDPSNQNMKMGTVMSTDRGLTWQDIDLGYATDFGVLGAGDGYTLGGGEGAVKGQPTIFKTVDGVSVPVLQTQENTFWLQRVNGAWFVGTTAHSVNRYAKIYRSGDDGDTWETVYSSDHIREMGMNAGFRYGLFDTIPAKEGRESQLMVNIPPAYGIPSMRIFEGGDHYQGNFYVKVPVFPAEGLTLKVGHGYLAEDIEGNIFNDNPIIEPTVRLPLNEYGQYVYDNRGLEYEVKGADWVGEGKRYGFLYPLKQPAQTASVQLKTPLIIPNQGDLNFNKNFTVNVWMRWGELQGIERKFLFGRVSENPANNLFFSRDVRVRLGIQFGNNYEYITAMIPNRQTNDFIMFTVVVTDDLTPDLRIFLNGSRKNLDGYEKGSWPLIGFNNAMEFGDWMLGGAPQGSGIEGAEDSYMTDFSIYDTALSDDEIRRIYEGANILKP